MRKFFPYILILITFAVIFSLSQDAQASPTNPNEPCTFRPMPGGFTQQATNGPCMHNGVQIPAGGAVSTQPGGDPNAPRTALDELIDKACNFNPISEGCILRLAYWIFYSLASGLLWLSALLFNALVSISISSTLIASSAFIPDAWGVVRDISNIFFILVLLFIAIQTILGIGGHGGPKKMIAQVIIMALLINFSMFFTKVVIDTANILALVFYNKMEVTTNVNGQREVYTPSTPYEKDLSGAMMKSFDPTQLLTKEFFDKAKVTRVLGRERVDEVPFGIIFTIILVSGMIMLFAAYAFFISGLSFLGRLIQLWILIIFSPFAFVSSTIPILEKVQGIGWKEWLHSLISTAFMAPIFMFFMYLIFRLVNSNIFGNFTLQNQTMFGLFLQVIIPALIILTMLLMATKYAKKGAGQVGEMTMGVVKMLGGLAIGGAALGVAGVGRGLVGATAKYVQNDNARAKDLKLGDRLRDTVPKGWSKANPFAWGGAAIKSVGALGKFATAGTAQGAHNIGLGKKMQAEDKGYTQKAHATSILDQKAKSEYGHLPGNEKVTYKDLIESEQEKVKKQVDLDAMAKFQFNTQFKDLAAPQKKEISDKYEGRYKDPSTQSDLLDPVTGNPVINPVTGLPVKDPATGTAMLPQRPIAGPDGEIDRVDNAGTGKNMSDAFAEQAKTNLILGELLQAVRKGSYDPRNLPDMAAKSKGLGPKMTVGLIAGVAAGIRMGMKNGVGIEHYGTPQRDIFKDIGNVISESLKNVKINISTGGGSKGDDHPKEVKSVGH